MNTVQEKKQEIVLNGVNVSRLQETRQAVGENRSLGQFRFGAQNRWLDGAHNRTAIDGYLGAGQDYRRTQAFLVDADEPPVLCGEDGAPNPVEHLLAALAGCMTTSLVFHAAARGIEVKSVESGYEGDIDLAGFLAIDSNVKKGYREIRVNFLVETEADEATLNELVRMSPVFDVVSNPTLVTVNFRKR